MISSHVMFSASCTVPNTRLITFLRASFRGCNTRVFVFFRHCHWHMRDGSSIEAQNHLSLNAHLPLFNFSRFLYSFITRTKYCTILWFDENYVDIRSVDFLVNTLETWLVLNFLHSSTCCHMYLWLITIAV